MKYISQVKRLPDKEDLEQMALSSKKRKDAESCDDDDKDKSFS